MNMLINRVCFCDNRVLQVHFLDAVSLVFHSVLNVTLELIKIKLLLP